MKKMSNHNIAIEVARANENIASILEYKKDNLTGEEYINDDKLSLFAENPVIANEFITTMSNQIVSQYAYDIFREFDMPFKSAMKTMSRLGDAEMYLTNELQDTAEYSSTNTDPFAAPKPRIYNNFIKTEAKRQIGARISEDLWAGAFITEGGLANIVGIILKNLRDSVNLYIYDELCKLIADTTKFSKSLTITTITGEGETGNSQKAYEQIMKLVNKMSLPSTEYNTAGKKTITPKGKFVLYLNADYKSSFDINVLASLFNSSSIELSKYFKDVRVVSFPSTASKQVGFICDEEALVWGLRIDKALSIVNPRTMELNVWLNRWIKWGTLPTRNAVRLMIA